MRRLTMLEQVMVLTTYLVCACWVVFCFCAYEVISCFGRRV